MSDRISVIVPVFQSAPYLHRCLDSILTQTHRNLELILVCDGAEETSVVWDAYARSDARIRVLRKENGSVSSARSIGLKNATGGYITFIDPKDWVHPQYLEVLLAVMSRQDVSVSICGFERVRTWFMGGPVDAQKAAAVLLDVSQMAQFQHIRSYLWGKLFRPEALERIASLDDHAFFESWTDKQPAIKAAFTPLAVYYEYSI